MKFSEKWLLEWIDIKINSDLLYDQISNSGIEIEYIKKFEPVFNGVLIGKIVECFLHPKLNNAKIVKVDIGDENLLNIVCNASNCRVGIKVAVATVGSILPKKTKINLKNIKGQLSEGMLCSFFELGLFTNSDQIIEFSKKANIGTDVHSYLSLKDNIIKVSTTSNRPDGLSILGLARNILAMNNLKLSPLKCKYVREHIDKKIDINIFAKKECTKFLGRIIEDINIEVDTPFWMKKKLFLSDIPTENVIIDIINYVLIEIGQPLNAINSDHVDDCIKIRMAAEQEKVLLKNNKIIHLDKNILVFSDKNKILFLPGNINSHIVEIDKNTKNIFLSSFLIDDESIHFIIKKTKSNKILEYYNYGYDPSLQRYAIEYATDLIIKICGGRAGPVTSKKSDYLLPKNNAIRLFHKTLNNIIGSFIESSIVSNILNNLDYQFFYKNNYWDVISPSWRFDILIEEDVIGDVLRIYGYNHINLTPLKENLNYINNDNKSMDFLLNKSSFILVNRGYCESINYGFTDPKIQDILFLNKKKLLISNPISKEMSSMRISLWPGLLRNVSYNTNRQQKSIRLFESGLCFLIDEKEHLGVKQEMFLAAVSSGNNAKENWYDSTRKFDFYDLKGDLEYLLDFICGIDNIEFKRASISGLHPEQSASIYFKKKIIGSIGKIDPRIEQKIDVNSSTFLFEILLNPLLDITILKNVKSVSKFPSIRRDIAILISQDTMVSDVINQCKNFFIDQEVEINLFDVYSCHEFFSNKKSLGISFIFQNEIRTLQDKEINIMINNCIELLKKTFQATLRM